MDKVLVTCTFLSIGMILAVAIISKLSCAAGSCDCDNLIGEK
jgi:hypothetical protein